MNDSPFHRWADEGRVFMPLTKVTQLVRLITMKIKEYQPPLMINGSFEHDNFKTSPLIIIHEEKKRKSMEEV